MTPLPSTNLRRKVAGVSLIAGPLLLLTSTVLLRVLDIRFAWYLTMKTAFVFFIFGVLGLVHMLRGRADGSGHVGGAMAIIGSVSGASIVTTAYVMESLVRAAPALEQQTEFAQRLFVTVANSPIPGLFFPVGLIVLAVALFRKKVIPVWTGLVFALGAALFPVGRVGGFTWALLACDILLTVALGYVGLRVLGWTAEQWADVPSLEAGPAAAAAEPLAG